MAPVTLNRVGLLALTLPTNLEQQCIRLQRELYRRLGDSSFLLLPPLLPLLVSKEPADLETVRSLARTERLRIDAKEAQPRRAAGAVWLPVAVTPESALSALFERVRTLTKPVENPLIPQRGAVFLGGMGNEQELLLEDLPSVNGTSSALTVAAYELFFRETAEWWKQCNFVLRAKGRVGTG